jgi:hypothetical protein
VDGLGVGYTIYVTVYIRTPTGCQYTESKSRQQTYYDDMKEKKIINKEFQEAQTGEGKQKKGRGGTDGYYLPGRSYRSGGAGVMMAQCSSKVRCWRRWGRYAGSCACLRKLCA